MSYFTIKDEVREKLEEKKSTFIGHAKRVQTEEEAREFIDKIKSEFKDARHNVYAYIIGENRGIQRYTDDGEPQGTAGVPILDVIKKNGITDVVIVVTRYFGGILLGTGGLVRAYSKAASMAVNKSGIVEKVKGLPLYIDIEYDLLGKIQYTCDQNLWHIEDTEYSDKVCIKILTEKDNLENIRNKITEVTSGKVKFIEKDEKYYFKLQNRLYEDHDET